MNNTLKITPAPWRIWDNSWNVDKTRLYIGHVIHGSCNRVCILRSTLENAEENYANASLISSAPELYEALNHLLELAENEGWDGEIINKAKIAIKKARGENNNG